MKYFFKKSQKMIAYVLVAAMMLTGLMQYNLVNAEAATKTLHYEWSDTSKNSTSGISVSNDSTGKELSKDLSYDGTAYSKIYRIEKNKKLVIEVTGEGKITFVANSEASKDNSISVYETEGEYLVSDTTLTKDAKQYSVSLSGEDKHTITICNTGEKKLNVFFVEFTYNVASGDASDPSTEAPTEPSTEAPTEPSTEASSEESSEPSGEVVSEYNHNFSVSGKESTFYTIKGDNLKPVDVTVNGTTYTKALKMNKSGKVTFKSTKEGALTLVLSNGESDKRISVDGKEYAVAKSTVVITVDNLPAGDHTIERTNGETYLLYIGLSYAGDTTEAPAVKHRVELDGNIGVTFAFKDAVEGGKVTFTCDGKDSVDVVYDAKNVVTIDGTPYALFSYNVYATEMNKTIKATLYDAAGELIKEDTCSVAQYCKEMLGKESTDEATKVAINALLVYGAETDVYFGKDATWLAGITDASVSALSDAEKDALSAWNATRADGAAYETSDIKASGASLYFDTQMAVRIYFTQKDGTSFANESGVSAYTFKVTKKDGTGWNIKTGKNSKGFYVEIPNIGPKNLSEHFTITVLKGDETVQSVTYGPFTFVSNKLNDAKHTDLVTAIYRYNEALKGYGANE